MGYPSTRVRVGGSGGSGVDAAAQSELDTISAQVGDDVPANETRFIAGNLWENPTGAAIAVPADTSNASLEGAGLQEAQSDAPSGHQPFTRVTANTTLVATDFTTTGIAKVSANTDGGVVTLTVPTGLPDGTELQPSRIGSNNLIVASAGAETFDGDTTAIFNALGDAVFQKSGSDWVLVDIGYGGSAQTYLPPVNLALSATTFDAGTPSNGTITAPASGWTLDSVTGLPAGLTVDTGALTWAYDGTAGSGTQTLTFTQTEAGNPQSPHTNTQDITLNPAAGAPDFTSTGLTPAFAYHANSDTVTLDGNNRVTAVTGANGSPNLTTATTGPLERTDAAGNKCWRFKDGDTLDLPDTFTITPRASTIFVVGRQHQNENNSYYFSPKFESDGVTEGNTAGAMLQVYGTGNRAPWLRAFNQFGFSSPVNSEYLIVGSQLACFGMASRTTANGAVRFYMNGMVGTDSQVSSSLVDMKGGRIGGYRGNDNSNFDIYGIFAFDGELTDAQADSVSNVLLSFFSITAFTRNIILEGDSITAGVTEVESENNLGMALTEPGMGLVPANVRVVNMGVSGAEVPDMETRRDNANSWTLGKIGTNAADNIVAVQIGRNDASGAGAQTAATIYTNIQAYWNAATVGVATQGWQPYQMANIACDPGTVSTDLHALIVANFANDVAGGQVIDLQAIRDSAGASGANFAPFVLGAQNGEYYQDDDGSLDTTHPSVYGTQIMASGGDTPQHGYGAIL